MKDLCNENNIEFLVIKIPSIQLPAVYGSAWTRQRHDEVRQICEENGITFYDLLYDADNPINPATDFSDGGYHVNFLGTLKLSALLGEYLNEHYALSPERTAGWDSDLDTYKKTREIALLQLEYGFEDYLLRLKEMAQQKTVFISASDEMSAGLSEEDWELLRSFGIQTDFTDAYRHSFIAVIENGSLSYEMLSENRISYAGSTLCSGSEYSLTSSNYNTGSFSEIIIDGRNYSRNQRGLNIVVYDEESQTVVDSVCFDTYDPDRPADRDNALTLQYLQEYEYFAIEGRKP